MMRRYAILIALLVAGCELPTEPSAPQHSTVCLPGGLFDTTSTCFVRVDTTITLTIPNPLLPDTTSS